MSGPYDMIPLTVASAFAFGVILALLGSVKLPLSQRLAIDEARAGGLLAALNLALIPMMLLSGVLTDQLGVRGVILGGALLAALAVFLLGFAQTYRGALYVLLLVGLGGAGLNAGSVVLMPAAFFPGKSPAAAENLGNLFFGLGALITPALAEILIRALGFRRAMTVLAVVCLAPAAAASVVPADVLTRVATPARAGSVLADPVVWLAALVFLLYGPLEGTIGIWTTSYLTEVGFAPRRASLLLSAFWLAFLTARLLAALLQQTEIQPRNSEAWEITILSLLAAVVLANLAGTRQRGAGAAGILATGAVLGPIFPTLVGLLFAHTDPAARGTAYGLMYAAGAAGGLLLPPLIGVYARRTSVRAALRITVGVALLLTAAAVVLAVVVPRLP